jgi:hypothetical protein
VRQKAAIAETLQLKEKMTLFLDDAAGSHS